MKKPPISFQNVFEKNGNSRFFDSENFWNFQKKKKKNPTKLPWSLNFGKKTHTQGY
jgi:hypothetical protein